MKYLVICLILISTYINLSFSQGFDDCLFKKCVGAGETCLSNTSRSEFYQCQPGYRCNGNEFPTCIKWSAQGDYCDQDTYRCMTGYSCYQLGSTTTVPTCQMLYYKGLNESCSSNFECTSPLECKYPEQQCKLPNNAVNSCSSSGAGCGYGQYCDQGTLKCVAVKNTGEQCASNKECALDSICSVRAKTVNNDPTFRVCNVQLTKRLGERCYANPISDFTLQPTADVIPRFDCNITAGLYCGTDNICHTMPEAKDTPCGLTQVCPTQYDTCTCSEQNNNATSYCARDINITPECQQNIVDLINCVVENQCVLSGNSLARQGCMMKNCKDYVCGNSCYIKNSQKDYSCGSNDYNYFCTNSASFSRVSIILMISMISLLLLF